MQAEWLDRHIEWADNTKSTLGIVLAVELNTHAKHNAGEIKVVIAGGAAAAAGTVAKGDILLNVDGVRVEAATCLRNLYGTGWNERSAGTKSKAFKLRVYQPFSYQYMRP